MTVPRDGIRDREHAREVERWLKDHPGHPDYQAVAHEWVAFDWRDRNPEPASDHLAREVEAAHQRGRPLEPGESVPGCPCECCTGVPDYSDVVAAHRRERARERYGNRDPLDEARAVPVTEVARRLGLQLDARGWARCPAHADNSPSLHLNDEKGVAFCNPCGRSWDGIALVMELENLKFPEAVRWLTGTDSWRAAARLRGGGPGAGRPDAAGEIIGPA